jgi:hypothetical protein
VQNTRTVHEQDQAMRKRNEEAKGVNNAIRVSNQETRKAAEKLRKRAVRRQERLSLKPDSQ